jgi:hypothetical protein
MDMCFVGSSFPTNGYTLHCAWKEEYKMHIYIYIYVYICICVENPQGITSVKVGSNTSTVVPARRRRNTVSNETVMYGYWSSVTWPASDCTVSYSPVLSSERAPYRKNNKAIVTKERIRIKSGHGPQRGVDTKTNWSTDRRPWDKLNLTQLNSTHLKVCDHSVDRNTEMSMLLVTHIWLAMAWILWELWRTSGWWRKKGISWLHKRIERYSRCMDPCPRFISLINYE